MKKLFLWFFLIVSIFSQQNKLVISIPDDLQGLEELDKLKTTIGQSFKNLGYGVDFIFLPNLRSIQEANSGEIDGDFPRIKGKAAEYKNLFVVDVSLLNTKFYTYSLDGSTYNKWENMKNKNIGIMFGSKVAEESLKSAVPSGQIVHLKNRDALIGMLTSGRVDLLYLPEAMGDKILEDSKKVKIFKSNSPLYQQDVYLVLNKKYLTLDKALKKELIKNLK